MPLFFSLVTVFNQRRLLIKNDKFVTYGENLCNSHCQPVTGLRFWLLTAQRKNDFSSMSQMLANMSDASQHIYIFVSCYCSALSLSSFDIFRFSDKMKETYGAKNQQQHREWLYSVYIESRAEKKAQTIFNLSKESKANEKKNWTVLLNQHTKCRAYWAAYNQTQESHEQKQKKKQCCPLNDLDFKLNENCCRAAWLLSSPRSLFLWSTRHEVVEGVSHRAGLVSSSRLWSHHVNEWRAFCRL